MVFVLPSMITGRMEAIKREVIKALLTSTIFEIEISLKEQK